MFKKVFITKNSLETQKLGKKFAEKLTAGVIALYGDLGCGKTTFVQGLAKGFGIKKIISPTFIIVRTYKLKLNPSTCSGQNLKLFYHIDLYRIESKKDIQGLGIEEIMNDPKNIVVIEWAERMKNLLPKERTDIEFEYIDEDKRKIIIRSNLKDQKSKPKLKTKK